MNIVDADKIYCENNPDDDSESVEDNGVAFSSLKLEKDETECEIMSHESDEKLITAA